MSSANSPHYRQGLADGAADAMRLPSARRGYTPPNPAHPWKYRQGFARGFLAARRGELDHLDTLRMGRALDRLWLVLDHYWAAAAADGWQLHLPAHLRNGD